MPAKTELAKRILRTLPAIACIAGFAWFLAYHGDAIAESASRIDTVTLLLVCGACLAQWSVKAWRDVSIFGVLGCRPRWRQFMRINAVQLMLNYLPMKPGTAYTVVRLRQKFSISYTDIAGCAIVQVLLVTVAASAVAAVALMLHPMGASPRGRIAIALLLSVALVAIAVPLVAATRLAAGLRREGLLQQLTRGMHLLMARPALFARCLALSLAGFCLGALRLYLCYRALELSLTVGETFIINAGDQLSLLVSLTPAGLGIREGMVALMSSVVAIPVATAVLAATLNRCAGLLMLIFVLCWMFVARFYQRIANGISPSPARNGAEEASTPVMG